jgi:thiamine biosynthesis protein ThiS
MQIKVNGKIEEIAIDTSLGKFLADNDFSIDKVLASINGDIIQPQDYNIIILTENCEVDLMTFVAGG